MDNAVPICRSIEKNWIFDDAEYFKIWYCMLSRAQWKVEPTQGVYQGMSYTQHRGEFLFGRREWSRRYNVSEQRIRKLVELLVADNMIERKQLTRKFTIYLVTNYDKYNPLKSQLNQVVEPQPQPTENPQKTHEQPTENPQTPTIKTAKTVKTVKNKYGTGANVCLTQAEYERLKNEVSNIDDVIEWFSSYIVEKDYVSKDHNRSIRRWVIDAATKNKKPQQKTLDQFMEEDEAHDKI